MAKAQQQNIADRLPKHYVPADVEPRCLQEWLSPGEVYSLVNACNAVYPLARIRAGQPYVVFEDETGFAKLEYEINSDEKLVVCRDPAGYAATLEPIEYDIQLAVVEGSIQSNLFATMAEIDESPTLAVRLADIFAWEINFIRDIQPNDSFRVLVEKRRRDGEFHSYGKIKAAAFTNQNVVFEAYAFTDDSGAADYYNANGESVKRAFLKAPLSFTRISSTFSPGPAAPDFKGDPPAPRHRLRRPHRHAGKGHRQRTSDLPGLG